MNVSGGLESKGHPIAATGIANIWEVCHHLRGEAGDRQIEGAKVGLAHVIGLGSACGVHILEKAAAERSVGERASSTVSLSDRHEELVTTSRWDFSDLRAVFINCTLKRSPEVSHTEGLARRLDGDHGGATASRSR